MLKLLKTIIVLTVFLSNIAIAQKEDEFFKNRSKLPNRDLEEKEKTVITTTKLDQTNKTITENKDSSEENSDEKDSDQKDIKKVEKAKKVDKTIVNSTKEDRTKKLKRYEYDLYDVNPGEIYLYNEMNLHLPEFLYRKNYEDMFFENIKTDDIAVQNTLLDILQTTEIRNNDGDTPLIYASRLGKISSVRFLLLNKANICARNYAGYTAYQLAKTDEVRDAIETMIY